MYDEYKANDTKEDNEPTSPHSDDRPVFNSVMNSQWNATGGNFNWLNFSIAKNNTQRTAQHRMYGASGWETLARPVSEDPRDGQRLAELVRNFYLDLPPVAPAANADASLELPAAQTEARRLLNIVWGVTGAELSPQEATYHAQVASVLGSSVAYPQPVVLLASVSQVNPIAKAGVTASVTAPNSAVSSLTFKDDGVAPDKLANDGLYSAILAYNQNGNYTITVTFDNNAGNAEFTEISMAHSIGPNGETPDLTPQPVGQNFSAQASAVIVVTDFKSDDHGNTPATATVLPTNNTDMPGRIDAAGDVDWFKITPAAAGNFILRVSDLALSMQPKIRILGADGATIKREFQFTPQGNEYFFTPIEAAAAQTFYVEISQQNALAATGLYNISLGSALVGEDTNHTVYRSLPINITIY